MPEAVIERLRHSISRQLKVCFISAIIVGLAAHLYKIVNWLPNWDSLVFRYDPQNMIGIGRWFLPVVCALSSFYDLPFFNGLTAIIFHALGAVCICRMFNVKKDLTAAVTGAVVVSFPTVTSVMMYNYVADGYSIAFLLSCLAAMLLTAEKPKYIASVILIALSSAIYQAYITVTVMLLLLYLIDGLIFQKKAALYLLKISLKFLICGVCGVALYYLILTLLLKVTGETLLEYQGISSSMSLSNISVRDSLYVIRETFLKFFFDFSKGLNVFNVLNCVIFAITAAAYLICAIRNKALTPLYNVIVLGIYILLLPIGAGILAVVNYMVDYHNLMKMGYCIFYLFFIMLYERMDIPDKKLNYAKAWTVFLLSSLLIFNQVIIANVSYHKSQMAYERSYGTLIRIADRIEQTDGADKCTDILVIGELPGSEEYSANLPPDMTGITDGYILRKDDETVKQSVLCSALNDYCGKNYRFVSGKEKQALLNKDEIKQMNCWPQQDCVAVADGVIIIKLGAESE